MCVSLGSLDSYQVPCRELIPLKVKTQRISGAEYGSALERSPEEWGALERSKWGGSNLLYLVAEDLPAVVLAEAAARHDPRHPLRPQEDLRVAQHRVMESLVARDLSLAFQEALKLQ